MHAGTLEASSHGGYFYFKMACAPILWSWKCWFVQGHWQLLLQESPGCPHPLQAGWYPHTAPAHSLCISSLTHALTLSCIFELIALSFSCKTSLGLGASGQRFQLLCSHLGIPQKLFFIPMHFYFPSALLLGLGETFWHPVKTHSYSNVFNNMNHWKLHLRDYVLS